MGPGGSHNPVSSSGSAPAAHQGHTGTIALWLGANGLDLSDLTDERIQDYLDERRGRGHRWEICRQALAHLLKLLASRDMLPSPSGESTVSGLELLLARFRRYLLEERDLVRSTAEGYVRQARRFLQSHAPDGDVRLPLPADVGAAVPAYLRGVRPQTPIRFVFLSTIAPIQGLSRGGVSAIVRWVWSAPLLRYY